MMNEAICVKCQEPWELYYLAHEALYEYPGDHAPEYIRDLHAELRGQQDDVLEAHDRGEHEVQMPNHYTMGGEQLQLAVLKGEGCPACWTDPSEVFDDEDARLDALAHNLFNSGWDGDPAELL